MLEPNIHTCVVWKDTFICCPVGCWCNTWYGILTATEILGAWELTEHWRPVSWSSAWLQH